MTGDTPNPRDLEIVRAACLRHGQSLEEAAEVIETCLAELREGDSSLWISCWNGRFWRSINPPQTERGTIMTTVKYTTLTAAGAEVHTRAERHMSTKGGTYQDAVHVVLATDKQLAEAYAQPASQVATMATKPAVPVTGGDEREILDWVLRAVRDGHPGALPGALGQLSIEADKFAKIGMPIEEAARRAMDSHPHLVTMAKLLLADVRRNAPENTPVPADKTAAAGLAQGKTPGETVHIRAQALTDEHPHLDYHEAVGAVLAADPALKAAYARS